MHKAAYWQHSRPSSLVGPLTFRVDGSPPTLGVSQGDLVVKTHVTTLMTIQGPCSAFSDSTHRLNLTDRHFVWNPVSHLIPLQTTVTSLQSSHSFFFGGIMSETVVTKPHNVICI